MKKIIIKKLKIYIILLINMNHDDYLEHLGIYYSQKMKVLAKNPQFICKR